MTPWHPTRVKLTAAKPVEVWCTILSYIRFDRENQRDVWGPKLVCLNFESCVGMPVIATVSLYDIPTMEEAGIKVQRLTDDFKGG